VTESGRPGDSEKSGQPGASGSGGQASQPSQPAELPRWQPFADIPAPSPALPEESTLTPAPDVDSGSIEPEPLHDAPEYVPGPIGMMPGTVMPPMDPAEVPTSAWITSASSVVTPRPARSGLLTIVGGVIAALVALFVVAALLGVLPSDKGKILFGTAAGRDLCSVSNETTTVKTTDPIFFSAILKHHMDGNQAITLHITKDGKDFVNYDEPADGTEFDCYGNRDSLGSLDAGHYRFEVVHKDVVEASGDLTVK
jgi:hypothetical protein